MFLGWSVNRPLGWHSCFSFFPLQSLTPPFPHSCHHAQIDDDDDDDQGDHSSPIDKIALYAMLVIFFFVIIVFSVFETCAFVCWRLSGWSGRVEFAAASNGVVAVVVSSVHAVRTPTNIAVVSPPPFLFFSFVCLQLIYRIMAKLMRVEYSWGTSVCARVCAALLGQPNGGRVVVRALSPPFSCLPKP